MTAQQDIYRRYLYTKMSWKCRYLYIIPASYLLHTQIRNIMSYTFRGATVESSSNYTKLNIFFFLPTSPTTTPVTIIIFII